MIRNDNIDQYNFEELLEEINKTLFRCKLPWAKSAMIQHIEILSFASSHNHPAEIPRNSLHPVEQVRIRNSKFKSQCHEYCKI